MRGAMSAPEILAEPLAVLGIDPGLSGAVALYTPATGALEVRDMPTFTLPKGAKGKRTVLDLYGLAGIFDGWASRKLVAFVEQVGATPQMGVTSAFSFGVSSGAAEAMCAAHFIPMTRVVPILWKRSLRVPAAKDGARARASELLPRHAFNWSRAKDDGRAEAALIALYGAQQMAKEAT